ncbi:MAG: efflux transporter outer membrane subunit [Prevotella sp.]|nr:efflux transporter outer membrane subunit [Bacteroides sp.]MCM1365880.1 efflux transporter outer membrane subunit [Prevotella sp.]
MGGVADAQDEIPDIRLDSAIDALHSKPEIVPAKPVVWMLDSIQTLHLPTEDEWWKHFNDPILNKLIKLAEENNSNLKVALRRIELSRNALRQAKAGYFPTIDVSGGWQTSRMSGLTGKIRESAVTESYFNLGVSASWEVDVFGRIRQNVKAQEAGINATRADYTSAMISVCADVARGYINLRLYQEQLLIATRHINSQKRIVHITEVRDDTGLASMLDVAQATTLLYSTEASIPNLEALIQTSYNSLGLLIGLNGSEVRELVGTYGTLPDFKQLIPAAVPSDIVRRRPDIIAAQYQLDQTAALIGLAKKDYLPSLTIEGSIGTEAHNIGELFSKPSFTYMVSPTISWTAFEGNLRKLKINEQQLQLESDLDNYNFTVQTAAEEVNNAITNYRCYEEEVSLRAKVVAESEKSLTLALDRYKQGLSAFTNVVDAQQDLLTYQNSFISANASALLALIDLYVAIGGGWSQFPE